MGLELEVISCIHPMPIAPAWYNLKLATDMSSHTHAYHSHIFIMGTVMVTNCTVATINESSLSSRAVNVIQKDITSATTSLVVF